MKHTFPTCIAFIHATLIPIDSQPLSDHTVIVVDGHISIIGPTKTIPLPSHAFVIDATNKFLMPGLADMHVHISHPDEFILYLANGITSVRNMAGTPLHLLWQKAIERGEMLAPHLYTSGPLTDGAPPAWNGFEVIETAEEAKKIIALYKKMGYNFLKMYSKLPLFAYQALAQYANQEGFPFSGHIPFEVPLHVVLKSGQRSIEHINGYFDAMQADDSPLKSKFDASSRLQKGKFLNLNLLPELARLTQKSQVWNCPTFSVHYGLYATEEEERAILQNHPAIDYVHPLIKASWKKETDFRLEKINKHDWQTAWDNRKIYKKICSELLKARAPFLIGTDAPNRLVIPGYSIHDEISHFIDFGMSPSQILFTATLNAAQFMSQENIWGSITPGKRADLLLLNKNPLENVAHLHQRAGVMLAGKWLPEEQLQKKLQCIAEKYEQEHTSSKKVYALKSSPSKAFAAYTIFYNDVPFGSEVCSMEEISAEKIRLTSHHQTNFLEPIDAITEIIANKNFVVEKISLITKTAHHTFEKQAHAQDDLFESIELSLIPLLAGSLPTLISTLLIKRFLQELEENNFKTINLNELVIYPYLKEDSVQLTVTKVDETLFDIEASKKCASTKRKLLVDDHVFPPWYEIKEQLGIIHYKRTKLS